MSRYMGIINISGSPLGYCLVALNSVDFPELPSISSMLLLASLAQVFHQLLWNAPHVQTSKPFLSQIEILELKLSQY